MKLSAQLKLDSGYAWVMDRVETASPFGAARVREPEWYGPGREAELAAELQRVEIALNWDKTRMDELTHTLLQFRDIRSSFAREYNAPMDLVELFEVKHFLLHLGRLCAVYAGAPLDGIELEDLPDLLDLLDPTGRRLPAFRIEEAHAPGLERIRAEKVAAEQQMRNTGSEELSARRQEMVKQESAAELDARRRLTAVLLREKERLLKVMENLGRLDLILAKAALAKKYGCVKPCVGGTAVQLNNMVHPQVSHYLEGEYTPQSLELERGAAVVTGANMGGKSVALKALTLNLLLLHTGYFVFAEKMISPLFDQVGLIGADAQTVEGGLSSFAAEVKTLDNALKGGEGKSFFLALDEFARGTNPAEGAALARALVRYLNELNCVALLTTHYDGVAPAAARHYQVAGLDESGKRMDHSLILAPPDAPCPRDALKVCRLLNLDQNLLNCFEESN